MNVDTRFVFEERFNLGKEFLCWLGDTVFDLKYSAKDNAFVGTFNGRKTIAVFDYVEIEETQKEHCGYYTVITGTGYVNYKYDKYAGFDVFKISCATNKEHDYYKWSPRFIGTIDMDGRIITDTQKTETFSQLFEEKIKTANINNDKNCFRRSIDVDDCICAFEEKNTELYKND